MPLIAATGITFRLYPLSAALLLVGAALYVLGRVLQGRKGKVYMRYHIMRYVGIIMLLVGVLKIVLGF